MKKLNISLNRIGKFAGKWIALDPVRKKIIASGDSLEDVAPAVNQSQTRDLAVEKSPYVFLVPRKDEGPYILYI